MEVYIYAADIYCKACGEAIRKRIARREIVNSGIAPDDPDDESSYDSDEFPKGPYPDGGGESDWPQHCGSGEDCINAIELSDGTRAGVWLGNELTPDGARYVQWAIRAGGEIAGLWEDYYADCLPEGEYEDEEEGETNE